MSHVLYYWLKKSSWTKQQSVLSKTAPPDSEFACIQEANINKYLVVYSNISVQMGLQSAELFLTSYTSHFTRKLYRMIKKSPCTWWLQYKEHAKIFSTVSITYHDNVVRIRDNRWWWCESSVPLALVVSCQAVRLSQVAKCIVIIRCTETFWAHYMRTLLSQNFHFTWYMMCLFIKLGGRSISGVIHS
jgi:hypothetical protein